MNKIKINIMRNSSILRINSLRNYIQTDPDYQRMSEIWTLEKKQLLIDSIINDLDIPKIYFHEFPGYKKIKNKEIKYAIIDGKQRLEAIWAFMDNHYPLSDSFVYYADEKIDLSNMTYRDIAEKYPMIKDLIDSFTLPVVNIETDDIDMIEEMFSRLNEAVPLVAAEKRNAFGGPLPASIREISSHKFFKDKIAFSNKRYQHREMACKFLWLEYSKKLIDTKKVYLDSFVKDFKKKKLKQKSKDLKENVSKILNEMCKIFSNKDTDLLRTQSMPVIYFLVFKDAIENNWYNKISRKILITFDNERKENRKRAEKDISKAKYELLEFDRMTQQGTNDGVSIKFRYETLKNYLNG